MGAGGVAALPLTSSVRGFPGATVYGGGRFAEGDPHGTCFKKRMLLCLNACISILVLSANYLAAFSSIISLVNYNIKKHLRKNRNYHL